MAVIDRETTAGYSLRSGMDAQKATPAPPETFLVTQVNRLNGITERLNDINRELEQMLAVHGAEPDKKEPDPVALSEPVGPIGRLEDRLDVHYSQLDATLHLLGLLRAVVG